MTESGENVFTYVPVRRVLPNRRRSKRQTTLRPITFVASWKNKNFTQSQPIAVTSQHYDDDESDRCHSQPGQSSRPSSQDEEDSSTDFSELLIGHQGRHSDSGGKSKRYLSGNKERENEPIQEEDGSEEEEDGSEEEEDGSEEGKDESEREDGSLADPAQAEPKDQSEEDSDSSPGEVDDGPVDGQQAGYRQEESEDNSGESEVEHHPGLPRPLEVERRRRSEEEDSREDEDDPVAAHQRGQTHESHEEPEDNSEESGEEQDSVQRPDDCVDQSDESGTDGEAEAGESEDEDNQRGHHPEGSVESEEGENEAVEEHHRPPSCHAESLEDINQPEEIEARDPEDEEAEDGSEAEEEEQQSPLQDPNDPDGSEESESEEDQEMSKHNASTKGGRVLEVNRKRPLDQDSDDDHPSRRKHFTQASRRNSSVLNIDVSSEEKVSPNDLGTSSQVMKDKSIHVETVRHYAQMSSRSASKRTRGSAQNAASSASISARQSGHSPRMPVIEESPNQSRLHASTRSASILADVPQHRPSPSPTPSVRYSAARSRHGTAAAETSHIQSRLQTSTHSASVLVSESEDKSPAPSARKSVGRSRLQTSMKSSLMLAGESQHQSPTQSARKSLRQSRLHNRMIDQSPIQSKFQTTANSASKSQSSGESRRETLSNQSANQSRHRTSVQSASKSARRQNPQSSSRPAVQSTRQAGERSGDKRLRQSTLQFGEHSVEHSLHQSRHQSPGQTINQTVSQSGRCLTLQTLAQSRNEPATVHSTPLRPAKSRSIRKSGRIIQDQQTSDQAFKETSQQRVTASASQQTPSSQRQTLHDLEASFSILQDEEPAAKKKKKSKKPPKVNKPPTKPVVRAKKGRKRPAPPMTADDEDESEEEEDIDPGQADRSLHIWCGGERKRTGKDITDLDVILSAIEETVYEYKQGLDSVASSRAVTKFFKTFQKEMTDMIDTIGETKHQRLCLRKAAANVKSLQDELFDIEKENNKLQCEVYTLESAQKSAKFSNPITEWMSKTQAFLSKYKDSMKVSV